MAGVLVEREGWKVGRDEEEPFGRIATLADVFCQAGFSHWDDVFETEDWKLKLKPKVGEERFNALRQFQAQLLDQKESLWCRPEVHVVQILPQSARKDLKRKPFYIDNVPLFFLNPKINSVIYELLRGKTIQGQAFIGRGIKLEDLKKDIEFLDEYFGLKLELEEKNGKGLRYKLRIPKTTRVIESSVFKVL